MLENYELYSSPFRHYICNGNSLPDAAAREVAALSKPSELTAKNGSRADYKERIFLRSAEKSNYGPELQSFLDYLVSQEFRKECDSNLGIDLLGAEIRAEVVCDVDGFFQVPHTDVGDKRITWLTYLGTVDENGDVGTDIYNDDHSLAKTAPWGFNNGLIFVPNSNTWHGFPKGRKINGYRKVLIINFVDNWKSREEIY